MTPPIDTRKLIVIVTVALVLVSIVALTLPSIIARRQAMETTNPPTRQNAEYAKLITDEYPTMKDSSGKPIFSVVSAEQVEGNWYILTIENNANQDQLYTLVHDAKHGPQGMSLVLPPSVYFVHKENLTSIFIPDKIIRKMNCPRGEC